MITVKVRALCLLWNATVFVKYSPYCVVPVQDAPFWNSLCLPRKNWSTCSQRVHFGCALLGRHGTVFFSRELYLYTSTPHLGSSAGTYVAILRGGWNGCNTSSACGRRRIYGESHEIWPVLYEASGRPKCKKRKVERSFFWWGTVSFFHRSNNGKEGTLLTLLHIISIDLVASVCRQQVFNATVLSCAWKFLQCEAFF